MVRERSEVTGCYFQNTTADTYNHLDPYFVLTPNAWGIPESDGERVAVEQLDAVIIPLLMVDKQGHRVGYGRVLRSVWHNAAPTFSRSCRILSPVSTI